MSIFFGEFNPILPPARHLALIGKIAATWAQIENTMEVAMIGLYEFDLGRGLVFTSKQSLQSRLSILHILAAEKDGAIADKTLAREMRGILEEIPPASGSRNDFVHAIWTRSDKPGCAKALHVRLKGKKLVPKTTDYSANDLVTVADRLHDLSIRFSDLIIRLGILEKLERAERHSSAVK